MVTEAIEQRRGELFVTEYLDSLRERQIGGDDGRAAFVAPGQQIEEQLAAGALERHESQFIDDQKCDFLITLLKHSETPLVARLNQALHQIGGTREVNSQPPARGFQSKRDRQMRLTRADRAGQDYILGAPDEVATRQFHQLRP
jgi:hypothetical protein